MNYVAASGFDKLLTPSMAGALALAIEPQRTLGRDIVFADKGVHSNQKATMRIKPAPVDTGIVFVRTDVKKGARAIPALSSHVIDTRMCTVIANDAGASVSTVEHVMAALYAYGITNAVIEIDGSEVPIHDGSSKEFVEMIEQTVIEVQDAPRPTIQILSEIRATENGKFASLLPAHEARFSIEIDYACIPAEHRSFGVTLTPESFKNEVCNARTFGFAHEVEKLHAAGLALGASLNNTVAFNRDGSVLNEGGLRHLNEPARHKLLDEVGDLAMCGAHVLGHMHGFRTGHALNHKLVCALFADPSAWRYVAGESDMSSRRQAYKALGL